MAEKKFLVNLNLNGNQVVGAGNAVNPTDLVTKQQLDSVQAGLAWRPSVLDIQLDATITPVETLGSRYIVTDIAALPNAFIAVAGLANNDIVEHNGTEFVIAFDALALGEGYAVINKADDSMYVYDGANWEQKSTDHISADNTSTVLDGLVLSVKDSGIDTIKLADGAVTSSKIGAGEIVEANISSGNITEALLASNAVTSVKIATDAVTKEKIAGDVAGTGLDQDVDGSIKLADGYSSVIGDNSLTSIPVIHSLGTRAVIVQLFDTTTFEEMECNVVRTDGNTVTLGFTEAPGVGEFTVVIKAVL